jgi:hypothetical protein
MLDPPFKPDQNYNVLFAEKDGTDAREAAVEVKPALKQRPKRRGP